MSAKVIAPAAITIMVPPINAVSGIPTTEPPICRPTHSAAPQIGQARHNFSIRRCGVLMPGGNTTNR